MKNSTTKLKIAFVLDDSLDRPDGVQQYVKTLGAWLKNQGHTVHYLVGESQPSDHVHSLSKNMHVSFNKNRLTIPLPATRSKIKRLLEEEAYDILHVQMPFSPLLAGRVIQAAPKQTAVVGTFHILPFGSLQKIANKTLALAQKSILNRFDAVASVSSAAADFAKKTYGIRSTVIPNMVEVKRFRSVLQPHPGRIVFLGRLVPRKGCLELLQALEQVGYHEVLIAGDGPMRPHLEKFVREHRLKHIAFLSRIEEQHKADLLASAELAVFPSLGGESFGIVLIEAMAAGSGVVLGGNNPGYATVLGEWPEVLVDPKNTQQFANTLQQFLTDSNRRKRMHVLQQRAVKQYDVAVAGQQILGIYHSALQSHRNV